MNDYVSLNTLIEVIDGIPCIVNMKFQTGFGSYNCKFSQLDISIEDIYVIFTDRETVNKDNHVKIDFNTIQFIKKV